MQYLRVLGDFIVRPYEAFESHKGKYTGLSVAMALLLSAVPNALVFWFLPSKWQALLIITLNPIVNLFLDSGFIHLISRWAGGQATWRELVSVYGFIQIPVSIPRIIGLGVFAFGLNTLRLPDNPEIISVSGTSYLPITVLSLVMRFAGLIYLGLAVRSVYRLDWRKVASLVAVFLVLSFVNINIRPLPTRNVSWEVLPLMVEDVEEVHLNNNVSNTVLLKQADYQRGELVLVQLGGRIYLRTNTSANTYYQREVLAELFALPGDSVRMAAGTLYVNGQVVYAAPRPLPHLTLSERRLEEAQYFIYFYSPTLLGTETDPERFIIQEQQIMRGVEPKSLELVRRITR